MLKGKLYMMKRIVVLSGIIGLAGCIGEYYGYSEQEWSQLSVEQQKIAQQDYTSLVAEKNKLVQGDSIENVTTELTRRGVEKNKEADN